MKNCDKLKKKFYLGILMILSIGLLKVVDSNFINIIDTVGKGLFVSFVIILGIIGLYLSLPYLTCITDNNKMGKPPF